MSCVAVCCRLLLVVVLTEFALVSSQTRCGDATQGGTAAGADCVFPFDFGGVSNTECTDASHTKPWCYTAADNSAWGECIYDCEAPTCPILTKDGNAGGAACVFPFTYNGSPYYTCTSATLAAKTDVGPWCATTDNYDTGTTWGNCIILTSRDDSPCVFPFTYNGAGPYTECISVGCTGECDQGPWCGVDADGTVEDSDGDSSDWGYCNAGCDTTTTPEPPTTPTAAPATTPTTVTEPPCDGVITTTGGTGGGAPCVFPFDYAGVTYTACATENNADAPWCATAVPYNINAWGNCGACEDPTTPTQPPTTTPLPPLCPIPTTGGTGGMAPCVFPFIFNGVSYGGCITTNYDKPWCATVGNYDTEGARWGECLIETTAGDPCVFPFNFEGADRHECIMEGQAEPWCATTQALDVADTSTWGFCALPVGPDCVDPTTSTTARVTSRVTGECEDTFTMMPNMLSYLGQYQAGVLDVPGCEAACIAATDCQAFDWNRSQMSCYIHIGPSFLQFVTTSNTVDQYRKESCETTTVTTTTTTEPTTTTTEADTTSTTASTSTSTTVSTTSTTTEATTSATSTTTEATTTACTDTFDAFPAVNSYGGQLAAGATDLDACTAACLADEDCLAFDLNGVKCFLHYAGFLERLGNVAANTQYRRVKACVESTTTLKPTVITPDCELPYSMLAATLALGGTYLPTTTTVDDCKAVCTSVVSCVAIDFNDDTSKCYWHADLNDVVTGVPAVNQYRKGECGDTTTAASTTMVSPDGCVDTFEKLAETLSLGGTDTATTGLSECQAVCVSVPTCIAFDYNNLNMKCYWHQAGYESTLRSVPNVDQYRRVACDGTTAADTTPTTTTTVATTTTTAATTPTDLPTVPATTPTQLPPSPDTTTTAAPAPATTPTPTPTRLPPSPDTTTTASPAPAFSCTTGGNFIPTNNQVSVLSAANPTQGFIRTDIDTNQGRTVEDCGQKCCELVGCVAMDWRLQTDSSMLCYLLNGGYIDNPALQSEPGSSHYRLEN